MKIEHERMNNIAKENKKEERKIDIGFKKLVKIFCRKSY